MNKHVIILPLILASATALLIVSQQLPETNIEVVASPTPVERTASPTVSATAPTPTPSTGESSFAPTPTPSTGESPAPTPTPTPTPTPEPSELPSFGIVATTPEEILREAQIKSGRIDPFKSFLPPEVPEITTTISLSNLPKEEVSLRPGQTLPLPPEPEITDGLVLKGIIDGGTDPIAIIEVDGASQLIRVGEYLRGNILVTSIHDAGRYVALSKEGERARLLLDEGG